MGSLSHSLYARLIPPYKCTKSSLDLTRLEAIWDICKSPPPSATLYRRSEVSSLTWVLGDQTLQIDHLIGQGLDLAIQAERETQLSVLHLTDHYRF